MSSTFTDTSRWRRRGAAVERIPDLALENRQKAPTVLQKRSWRNSAPTDSPLLDGIRLVFLAFTDLDGLITFRLD